MNIKIFQKLQFEYLITYPQQCKLEVGTKHATNQSIIYKRNCLKANSQYTQYKMLAEDISQHAAWAGTLPFLSFRAESLLRKEKLFNV